MMNGTVEQPYAQNILSVELALRINCLKKGRLAAHRHTIIWEFFIHSFELALREVYVIKFKKSGLQLQEILDEQRTRKSD